MTKRILLFVLAGALAACALTKQDAPSPTGPSEFALSLQVTASPDHITQDGASSSVITVLARDAAGQPVRGLTMHADIAVNFVPVDFGALSSRTLSTGNDGRATIAYFAPPAPPPSVGSDVVVSVFVTPLGTDFANANARAVNIRLMRPGVILPPNGTPIPNFFFSPQSPRENETTQFDGSSSSDDGQIVSYAWSFGDGASGSGMLASHSYAVAGTYNVILTVKDDRGLSASTSPKTVNVVPAVNPTASFTVSPTNVNVGVTVNLNATSSTVPPGRTIDSYEWDFGDGTTGTGMTTSHVYAQAKTFTITLTVTDNTGRKSTTSRTLQINP